MDFIGPLVNQPGEFLVTKIVSEKISIPQNYPGPEVIALMPNKTSGHALIDMWLAKAKGKGQFRLLTWYEWSQCTCEIGLDLNIFTVIKEIWYVKDKRIFQVIDLNSFGCETAFIFWINKSNFRFLIKYYLDLLLEPLSLSESRNDSFVRVFFSLIYGFNYQYLMGD